jgi:hypothetical protein
MTFLKALDRRLTAEARDLIKKTLLPGFPYIGILNVLADFKNGRPVPHLLAPRDRYALPFLTMTKLIRPVCGRKFGWVLNVIPVEIGDQVLMWNYDIDKASA